jgi:hypothetical protein
MFGDVPSNPNKRKARERKEWNDKRNSEHVPSAASCSDSAPQNVPSRSAVFDCDETSLTRAEHAVVLDA